MKWDDLRYILAVARHGTIAQGAASLGVDATTVSRRLRMLEQDTRSELFEKLKHGAVLTPAGEEMVRTAEMVEELTQALDAQVQGMDAKLEGSLRVTSTSSLLSHFITDFGEFKQRYPGIELELSSTMSVANLTQREADIAIRVAKTAPDYLIGRKYAELGFAVYGSPALIERVGAYASYAEYPWLSWDLGVARGTDVWLDDNVKDYQVLLRVNTMPLMVDALEAGLGLTILNTLDGDTNPRLRRVGTYFEGGLFVWVLAHPKARGSARIRAFVDFMREVIERDKDLIEGRCPQPTDR